MSVREKIKEYIIPRIAEANKKNGQILWPLRVALTGKEFSPGAFEMIDVFNYHDNKGIDKAISRIEKVIAKLV